MWRKTVVATAIVGAGLAATTGSAFAGEDEHDGSSSSSHSDHGRDSGHDDGGKHRHKQDGKDDDKHDGKHRDKHDGKDEGKHSDRDDDRGGDQCGSDVATEDDGETTQKGLVNVSDTDTIVPSALCQNNVPVNVLGVQVPIQDLGLNLPVLSPSEDGGGNTSEVS